MPRKTKNDSRSFTNKPRMRGLLLRKLALEPLERRLALSADLGVFELQGEHHHDEHGIGPHSLVSLPIISAADPARPEGTLTTGTPLSLAETFQLESLPNATKTIFLDFDGHTTSGTLWNSNYNSGLPIVTPAYDFDGNTSAFSNSELQTIQWIWERVSEDFIPFDVNVTTKDPGAEALTKSSSGDIDWGIRLAIGGSSSDWWGPLSAGVAYIGSFNWSSDTPAFVFEAQLGNGDEKFTAEAISHEAGHALGLSHDGRTSPAEEYFAGHGSGVAGWAPVMGSAYYQNVTQWSKGEYANASQLQDDLAIISGSNGFSYRPDDHGNSVSSASLLSSIDSSVSDWGIIETTADVDVFAFNTDAGTIQLNASPLDRGPNLDVFLELYDAQNQRLAFAGPSNQLSASISATVSSGQYFLHVRGTGNGDPASNGYSPYASLGQYFVSGSIIPTNDAYVAINTDEIRLTEGDSGSTSYSFVVQRTGNTNQESSFAFDIFGSGSAAADAQDFAEGTLPGGSVTFLPGETTKTITVSIVGDLEVESDETFTLRLNNATQGTIITQAEALGAILDDDQQQEEPAAILVTPTSGLSTHESGSTDSFTVSLTSQPMGIVTIPVASLDTNEGSVSTQQLEFSPENWQEPQVVTVTGVDDNVRDGNVTYTVWLGAAQSEDSRYAGLDADDVQVTNRDDEKGGKKDRGNGRRGAAIGLDTQLTAMPIETSPINPLSGASMMASRAETKMSMQDISDSPEQDLNHTGAQSLQLKNRLAAHDAVFAQLPSVVSLAPESIDLAMETELEADNLEPIRGALTPAK